MMFYTQLYDHFNWQDPIFADIYTSIYLFYLQKICCVVWCGVNFKLWWHYLQGKGTSRHLLWIRCIYRCHNWRPLVRVWRCVWWAGDSSWSAEPSPARCGGCSSSSSPALTHIVKASPSGGRGGQQLTGLGGTCRQHRTPPATAASHLHWKYFAFRVDTRFKNKKVCVKEDEWKVKCRPWT